MNIQVKDVSFGYKGHPLLFEHLNFEVESGDMLAIIGKNGVGKSTLIHCILGILTPVHGDITMVDARIGYVPQKQNIDLPYSVLTFVCLGLTSEIGVFSVPEKHHIEAAERILRRLNIYHLKDQMCHTLSGGQVQLAFLARALVLTPDVLVLDEPENHLDIYHQKGLYNLLKQLMQEQDLICIVNTHHLQSVFSHFNKVLLMGEETHGFGLVTEILTVDIIASYFDVAVELIMHKNKTHCIVLEDMK